MYCRHWLFLLARYLTLAAEFEVALADGNFFVCVLLLYGSKEGSQF